MKTRYQKRKIKLESIGAVYSAEDEGFICGDCFIEDKDVLNGDEEDFEETIELAKMCLYNENKK